MSMIENQNIGPFEKRFGHTHIADVWIIFFLILADVFIFSREHLHSRAGWVFMVIVAIYVVRAFHSYAKMPSLSQKRSSKKSVINTFLLQIGEAGMQQKALWRNTLIGAGMGLSSMFITIGWYNALEGIYIALPWVAGTVFFIVLVVIPFIGIYLYCKRHRCKV